jgi:hypothetical protein
LWRQQDTIDLGKNILPKRRYYLDTKYWIYLINIERGRGTSVHKEISHILHSLVENGNAICPISYHSFIELEKQSNRKSLLATAKLMDKLSAKVCFIPYDGIFQQELICYLRSRQLIRRGLPAVSAAKYVWTNTPFLFGDIDLEYPDAPKDDAEVIKKGFSSFWKTFGLSDLLSVDTELKPFSRNSNIVETLNEGKDKNQNWTTFEQISLCEIEGGLSVYEEDANQVLSEFSNSSENGDPRSYTELLEVIKNEWKSKGIIAGLPFLSIMCLMHSFLRYNKTQRFKPNDLADFGHAAWAIPYCHAFFTERSLASMTTSNLLRLDQIYGTKILWKEEEVLEYLKNEMELSIKQ